MGIKQMVYGDLGTNINHGFSTLETWGRPKPKSPIKGFHFQLLQNSSPEVTIKYWKL
jgi:hypothetical protein